MLLCIERPIISGAPILPSRYIFYASPFIIASPLIVLGYGKLREMTGDLHMAPLLWLAAVMGLEGYAVFGNSPLGYVPAYRIMNFLFLPLAILSALGIHRMCFASQKLCTRNLMKLAAAATVLLIVAASSYSVYAAVSLQERYMGYFWLYTAPEYEASKWISTTAGNQTVAGDVKVSYLLNGYFDVNVNVLQGLRYLSGEAGSEPKVLLVYKQMLKNGYVLYGGLSVDLPEGWIRKASSLNLVYDNGLVKIHSG